MSEAANAVVAEQAESARQILVAQQLAKCREENNPYKNSWFPGMAPRSAMWAADPCADLEEQLRGATTENMASTSAGSRSNAPNAQDLASAPAPQLSSTFTDPIGSTDPAIPESEFAVPSPALVSMWSPTSIEETMCKIAEQIEKDEQMMVDQEMARILDLLEKQLNLAKMWMSCWGSEAGRFPVNVKLKPKNQAWVGRLMP